MDSGGVSIVSAKPLKTDQAFTNQAFVSDDGVQKGSETNGTAVVGEVPPLKRNSSSVEFSLPVKPASKDRDPSLSSGPYRGMGKEELLRYSSRPLWRNLRYICMSTVLIGWLALLITVVALVLTYPSCRSAQNRDWWQKTVIYRVYVKSFFDSGSDGIGDINGVRLQLDYLQKLGVDTISLSPIYTLAPNASTDTHIVNHTSIDEAYGTLEDFQLLVNETHQKDMHIILDFIPNHTSDQHPWFLASKSDKDEWNNAFRSFYVWSFGRGNNALQTPNLWKSANDRSSAWTMANENYFYLHQFMESMPDLNLRSTKVREALKNILKFWLELGVDGFYIRHADYLFEDYDLRDGIYNETNVNLTLLAGDVVNNNKFMRGLTENFDMFARWRAFLDDYGNMTNQYRILFADVDSSFEHVRKYYGMFNRDGVDFPLNEFSLHLNDTTVAEDIRNIVQNWTDNMAKNHWPNWMGGNDRTQRLVDRLGAAAGPYLILIMLLPGTPYVYYGDEIGLSAVNNISSTQQHQTMGLPMRGLQQWNNNTYAGFCMQGCSSAPWMNTNPEYKNQMNVEAQKKDLGSVWNLFRNLTILRKENPAFEYGDYAKGIQDDEVFSFVREYDGQHGFLVALNFVNKTVNKAYTGVHETIPGSAKVELVTGAGATHSKGDNADLTNLPLAPFEGIVVSWDYQAKEL